MYYEYSLYAVPTILVTGLAAWLYLKLRGQAERARTRILFYGTAIAILIALLMPVTARLLYQRAGLSVFASLAAAFLSLAIAAGIVLFLANIIITDRQQEKEKASGYMESAGDAAKESAVSRENLQAPPEATYDDKEILTEESYLAEMPHEDLRIQPETSREDVQDLPETPREDPQILPEAPETGAEMVDTVQIIDKIGDDEFISAQDNAVDLLDAAMKFKMDGNYPQAVSCYRRALEYIQDKALLTWVVIDLCGLAKILKDDSMIREILDSEKGKMLDSGIADEILNNI